ncbi:hypothetical protein [Jannaschia marina]|uniref:hypothetical protein n=1 Tax=Jannaschia marina TaxID=2741674 RepID=UPI0015C74A8C|nr:hypothetical protein [Jannaschia marina]
MIRAGLLCLLAMPAGAVEMPTLGPEISACLERHVTSAPYVAALASEGWSPVRPFDRPGAQLALSHAMLAIFTVVPEEDDHGHDHDHDAKTGWAARWTLREDTLAWIEDKSVNRTLYERGEAVLLLMGEQITDPEAGRIHRTTCLFGAPAFDDATRILADVPVVQEMQRRAFAPHGDTLPYTSVTLARNLPPAGAEAPLHLDAIITTQVFAVRDVEVRR